MADLLKEGSAWLSSQRHSHMSSEVEYQRGTDRIELNATVGRTTFEQEEGDGRLLRLKHRDYLLQAEDLAVLGTRFVPERGHRIRELFEDEGIVRVYEVRSPAGIPPFEYADPLHKTIRVHTTLVATEES
jgi:hypothetical protein